MRSFSFALYGRVLAVTMDPHQRPTSTGHHDTNDIAVPERAVSGDAMVTRAYLMIAKRDWTSST
jgi:hypothetical protein